MSRILGIELRRSAALGTALIVAVAGTVLLYFAAEGDTSGGWIQLAMTQRLFLAVLWPLALAAGAWQATRERRSNVLELFGTTPRPRSHRVTPTLIALAVAVVTGYLAMGAAGGVRLVGAAGYVPWAQLLGVTAVGALALVAAAWLGLAVGRLLPWLVTAPALAVAGLAVLLFTPWATRPHGWLALVFSPIYEMNMPGAWATVPGRASAAQALWLAGLAGAAVLLVAFNGWRLRVAALLPLAVGAALAITVMPHQNRYVLDAVDPVARELVCADGTPEVCVSRAREGVLDDFAAGAREGLAVLAKLPGAPTRAHEDTTIYYPDDYPAWQPDTVLVRIGTDENARLVNKDFVAAEVVTGAFAGAPDCDGNADLADRLAAAYWLIGKEPVMAPVSDLSAAPEGAEQAVTLWQSLRGLPDDEAQARVVAFREASVACKAADGLFPETAR